MGELGEYVILYLAAFMLSVFLVPAVRRLALRVGAIDVPDRVRKIHTHAVPRMGGVAIFIAFIVPVVGAYVVGRVWFPRSAVYLALEEQFRAALSLLGASTLILLLGVYDDIRHARPRVKVVVQIAAALILCGAGIRIDEIGNPFTGKMIEFGWWSWPVTVFWILGVTNAINLIDGMDGLGPGVGLFVASTLLLISLLFPVPLVTAVLAALVGAVIGFLIFNFHPAKIFLGDSGSLFVGFLLATIAIQGSVKRHMMIPIIALALPIVDTFMAIVRRWTKGLPMSVPDKQHIHHRLIKLGFSQREAVLVLYGISAILGCAALVIAFLKNALAIAIAGATIIGIIVAVYVLTGGEFIGIGSQIAQAWRRRRRRRQAWVEVYDAKARMESATSIEQMWDDVSGILGALDFDVATMSLTGGEGGSRGMSWTRPGSHAVVTEDGSMREGWTIRLPVEENGHVRGELVLGKDVSQTPLLDALPDMVEMLRTEIVRNIERLDAEKGSTVAGAHLPSDAQVGPLAASTGVKRDEG